MESPTRQRILEAARELFYQDGIRAVGIDTIIERSGVAKASLYHWFKNKNDLVSCFLAEENAGFWAHWNSVEDRLRDRPRQALAAHLQWICEYIRGSRFRGCPFLNTAAEFRDSQHPSRSICRANKIELKRRLAALASQAGIETSEALADQLVLLIDGAFANSQVLGKNGPVRDLPAAGNALIDLAMRKPRVSRRSR